MDFIRDMQQTLRNMSISQSKPQTIIAAREAAIHLGGCSAYIAIICKAFACCPKYTHRYLQFIDPVLVGLFLWTLCHAYQKLKQIMDDWKREETQKARVTKSQFVVKQDEVEVEKVNENTECRNGGKSKRKNHRGRVKAKKAKGKVEGVGSASSATSGEF
ncbi:hypothetical protein SBOR_9763 [Sclerotinia borealis F-4128]|uniref:Uncharacterized protein n=1 Tax=Sclerotinia borealis (strain F-4128) TaxID=1432307 RepID=W9C1V0_SCLBF|nr:hypothetical protein SBOR_9763 [Sclerotinia borealis F-4128]